jgi:Pectate lyase superfamily protein
MKAARAGVTALVLYGAWATLAHATCSGTSVSAFGAKGDGKTDDTAAIQSAISAAASAGGGAVVFNVARYYTTGTFLLPASVILCGAIEGPFDVEGASPAATSVAPTLLVTNTSAPFITLNGLGAGITDLLFHYPNQVGISASAPNVYPYTILAGYAGTKVVRSTVTNAYNFLDIESGRVLAQDLFIGAFNIGVNVDHAYGHVTLRNLLHTVYWDVMGTPSTPPTPIDNWVTTHGIAVVVNRVDGIEVHDLNVFIRYAGVLFTDSPDSTQSPRCGFGAGSDIDLDGVQNGIFVTASGSPGYQITNLTVSTPGGGAAVQVKTGGSLAPDVVINGGSVIGSWSLGAFPTSPVGHLKVVNVVGFDLP